MLGTKLISLFFRVNIYNKSGVTQQPTVLVLEEIIYRDAYTHPSSAAYEIQTKDSREVSSVLVDR